MFVCSSIGRIRYSPKQLGDHQQNWWLVLDCDPEIGKYYRHLYWLSQYKCNTLVRPAWGEHISVVRNEKPPKEQIWRLYNNQEVKFYYGKFIQTDGEHFWLGVSCPILIEMRTELGLPKEPDPPLHLTVGHVKMCEEAEKIKKKFGFTECPICGTGHRDRVIICRECGYKGGLM